MNTEKLTLETLATAAQQGKREVLPLLWEKTERLIKKLILKTINKRILPTHIEESDVLQCGYFALLAAVRAFKNSGLKFTSYLSYSVQNAVNECIYGQSRRENKFKEVSYNQTVTDKSGDDVEMLDLIADEGAELDVYEPLELSEMQRIVIEAVDALPQRQRHFIRLHYFNNRSIKDIAAEQGCSVSNIQQIEQQAFRELRKNKRLRALNEQLGAIDFVRKFDYYRISPEYCTAILAAHALEKKLLQDSSVSYGQRQAQIFMLLCKAEQDYRQHNQEQGNSG